MINVDECHYRLRDNTPQRLAFDEGKEYGGWKEKLREKFVALSGLDEIAKNACPLNVCIESVEDKGEYRQIRFTFDSEIGLRVPCYLLVPKTEKKKYPLAITLQGHTTGFHNSIGEIKYDGDENDYPNEAYAVQAVKRGFIALAVEQRGFGEQKSPLTEGANCQNVFTTALLLGRTIIGERVWDVHRAIDAALSTFDKVDGEKIVVAGHSGGGTAAYYAACYDERIKICASSCSFCPYKDSILKVWHCGCNYIPKAYQYFEMEDLAGLLAPRKLVVVTGEKDTDFPVEGVKRGFATVQKIYEKAGAKDGCKLIVTPQGHRWCEALVWGGILEETKALNW